MRFNFLSHVLAILLNQEQHLKIGIDFHIWNYGPISGKWLSGNEWELLLLSLPSLIINFLTTSTIFNPLRENNKIKKLTNFPSIYFFHFLKLIHHLTMVHVVSIQHIVKIIHIIFKKELKLMWVESLYWYFSSKLWPLNLFRIGIIEIEFNFDGLYRLKFHTVVIMFRIHIETFLYLYTNNVVR